MAWETRRGTKRRYYTRSRRVNGVVQREYLGCGELARLSAEIDTAAYESQAALRPEGTPATLDVDSWYASIDPQLAD